MTFITVSKHTAACQCPSEITAGPFAYLLSSPCFAHSSLGHRRKILANSWELFLFGFQRGIAKWKALGERLEEERKAEARAFLPTALVLGGVPENGCGSFMIPGPPCYGPSYRFRSCRGAPLRWFQFWDSPVRGMVVGFSCGWSLGCLTLSQFPCGAYGLCK